MPLYRRTPNGPWWVKIGRKTRVSTGTKSKKDAAEFERNLVERTWRRDKLGDRSAVSWKEASERWIKDSTKPRKRDRELLAWLAPRIDEHMVSEVADPDALEEIRQDGIAEGWSHSTVDRLMGTVSAVLHACAKKWHYLEHAPAVPMYRPSSPEPRWLTPEEFAALRRELPPHLKLAARFAVLSLLRMRAMLRLTWDRIDLENRRAWIPKAHQKANKTFGFSLSVEAVEVLRELRALNPKGKHVFQWKGNPIDDCNTEAFQKAMARAGIEGANWHTLRHTGASWAVQAGVPLQEVMVMGDWSSYDMVLKYAHLAPASSASSADKVAQWGHIPTETETTDGKELT
jgi:integrase